jgi:putative chitobiose transport system substrate-binding protein
MSRLLIFLLVLFFVGCTATPGVTKPIILELWTLQLQPFASTLVPMLHQFEEANPGVKVHWVDLPFSEGEKRVLSAMLSPHPPDVLNLNPEFSTLLATRGALVNMNSVVSPATKASYLPLAWQAVTLIPNNPQLVPIAFGLPWYLTSSITVYNQRLLAQVGWPHEPSNFTQLFNLCHALRTKTAGYCVMPAFTEGSVFQKLLGRAGIPIYQRQGNGKQRAVFANHGASQFLQQWVSLYQQGDLPPEVITEGHRAAVDRYQSGSLGLLLGGANFLKLIKENAPKIYHITNIGPQFPKISIAPPDFSVMLLAVPANSHHQALAVKLATFITNATNQLALSQVAPVLPSVVSALQSKRFKIPVSSVLSPVTDSNLIDKATRLSATQLLAPQQTNATLSLEVMPQQSDINDVFHTAVVSALLGKKSAQQAMQWAETNINILLNNER